MADRFVLIARKQDVRQQIERVRRRLEREQGQTSPNRRQISQSEAQLDQLMAEEATLRVQIDQSHSTVEHSAWVRDPSSLVIPNPKGLWRILSGTSGRT